MAAFRNALRHEHARTCRSTSCSLLLSSLSTFFFVGSFLLSCVHCTTSCLRLACRLYTVWLGMRYYRYVYFCCTPRFYPHLRTLVSLSILCLPVLVLSVFLSSSLSLSLSLSSLYFNLTPLSVSFNRRTGPDHRKLRVAIRLSSITLG